MGLDSYLYKRTYISPYDKDKKLTIKLTEKDGKKNLIEPEKVRYVEEEIAYWRKANHIHNYFVQHCGDGVDECQVIYVSKADLAELIARCNIILNNKDNITKKEIPVTDFNGDTRMETVRYIKNITDAEDLLPTTSGFFFGSTDYDEYYLQDLEKTVELLTPYLEEKDDWSVGYVYQASW